MARLKGGKLFLDLTSLGDITTLSVGDGTTSMNVFRLLHDYVKNERLILPNKQLECKIINGDGTILVNPIVYEYASDGTYCGFNLSLQRYSLYFDISEFSDKLILLSITREENFAIVE